MTDLPSFNQIVRMALRLDPEIFAMVQTSHEGLSIALLVMLLAAISEAVGQSIILFLNRVRPVRFIAAQTIAVISNVIGYLLWTLVIWLAVWFVFGQKEPFVAALAVVGLAYAPQLFAFFEVTPFLGNSFGIILSLWSMAAIVVAIQSGMGLGLWQAALTAFIGWLVIQVWRRSIGRPILALGRFLQKRAAGTQMTYSLEDVQGGTLQRARYSAHVNSWLNAQREKIGKLDDTTVSATIPGDLRSAQPAQATSAANNPARSLRKERAKVESTDA